jgi:hypothetical protein
MNRVLFVAIALAVGLLASSCESFVTYSVINNTDRHLLMWTSVPACGDSIGERQDYGRTEVVPPRQTFDHFSNVGSGPYPRCVYIATTDRRVVAAERYREDMILTIDEPLIPGAPFPERNDLPTKSYWEEAKESLDDPVFVGAWVLMFLVSLTIVLSLGAAIVLGLNAAVAKWRRDASMRARTK